MTEKITIIGGGLTGLSLAIALRRRGVEVALHEAGSYPRHRVCGEFISGVSESTLEDLGIASSLTDAQRHRSVTWFGGDRRLSVKKLPSPALAISRHLLDKRLSDLAIQLGVDLFEKSRKKTDPQTPGLVWCAGRRPTNGKWIGLKAHVRNFESVSDLEMHSGPIGYLGITAVEDGWSNACGLFKLDRTIKAQQQGLLPAYLSKNGNKNLSKRLSEAAWKPESFTAVAGFELGLQKPIPDLLTLGDSHSIIPPFTGNGMSMAFQAAQIALPELINFAHHNKTWEEAKTAINQALKSFFSTRLRASRLIHPCLFNPVARPLLKHAPLKPVLSLIR